MTESSALSVKPGQPPLAFDSHVAGIASQPFWLRWPDESGRAVATNRR